MPDFHFRYFRSFQIDPYSPSFFYSFWGTEKEEEEIYWGLNRRKIKGGRKTREDSQIFVSAYYFIYVSHSDALRGAMWRMKKIVIELKEKRIRFAALNLRLTEKTNLLLAYFSEE